ncbi:MAG: flagellar biosynthesis anti-sigma factor FlgM [Firmicutes bacterium]|nr:flagellar biosynthesis anti-sigma factor FlgM [Bacillota bacterium]MCL5040258.1 flagellar biosynthesis anti-sigma factor FlgM [Bacillota bacterium]
MIISNNQVQKVINAYLGKTESVKKNEAGESKDTRGNSLSDQVSLSLQAREIERIRKGILSLPEVREDRVKEVQEKIKSGNYQIEAADVAAKILARNLADRLS